MASLLFHGLLPVNFRRIEHPLADHFKPSGRDLAEEAAPIAFVAGGPAHLLDAEQDGVQVAVHVDGADPLDVAALFAFAPESLAAAAVVDGPAGGQVSA